MTDFSPLDSALYESTPEKIAASLRYLRKTDAVMAALMPMSVAPQAPPAALAVLQDLSERFSAMHANGDVWITSVAAAKMAQTAAAQAQQPAAAVPEVLCTRCGHPTMHMGSMCYGCTQAGMLAAANKENNNG